MKNKLFFIQLCLVFALLPFKAVAQTAPNSNCGAPFGPGYVEMKWNSNEGRYEFKIPIANRSGNSIWLAHQFELTFNGLVSDRFDQVLILQVRMDKDGKVSVTPNYDINYEGKYWYVHANNNIYEFTYHRNESFATPINTDGATYATVYWYPNHASFVATGKRINFKVHNWQGTYTYTTKSGWSTPSVADCYYADKYVEDSNPLSGFQIDTNPDKTLYQSNGYQKVEFYQTSNNTEWDKKTYLQLEENTGAGWTLSSLQNKEYSNNSILASSSLDYFLTGHPAATVNEGISYRMRAFATVTYSTSLTNPLTVIYERYSNEFKVAPLPMPLNPTATYLGAGKVRLNWDVKTPNPVNSQAGNVHVYLFAKSVWNNVDLKIDYNKGKDGYVYTLPDTLIGNYNDTLLFEFNREPFTNRLASLKTEAKIKQNLNYKQITSFDIGPLSGAGIYIKNVVTDDGYITDGWKYKIVVKQGNKEFTDTHDISPEDVGSKYTEVNLGAANFTLCDPIEVYLNLYDAGNVLKVENQLTSTMILFNDDGKSKLTSIQASKGFYSSTAELNWTAAEGNNFIRYHIYRQRYGNEASKTLLQTVEHVLGRNTYSWIDDKGAAGVYYVYSVEGQVSCGGSSTPRTAHSLQTVGFCLPYGTISGRIAYEGSVAVKGATIMVKGKDAAENRALGFQGGHIEIPCSKTTFSPDAFSFQAWIKPEADNTQWLMSAYGKYAIGLFSRQIGLDVYSKGDRDAHGMLFDTIIPNDLWQRYFHLAVTFERKSDKTAKATLYLDGKPAGEKTLNNIDMDFNYATPIAADSLIYLASSYHGNDKFKGNLDEVRFWNKTLSADEVEQNYNCYISGKEAGLTAYYRFDEPDGIGEIYDVSGRNSEYNQNHGVLSGQINRNVPVPTAGQLSIKGITDQNGSYLINTIPYGNEGSTCTIIPNLGIHKFDPSEKPLFFSAQSAAHNNIDFKDVSAFNVSGTVVYEDGTYPSEDCRFEVDDRIVTLANGQPVTTAADGTFTISVPIGVHKVRVVKSGHTFVNDGLLLDADRGNRNYNDSLSNIRFYDRTRIKLIGRVAGGLTENNKPLGFGASVNNTGASTITLIAAKSQYNLQNPENVTTEKFTHNRGEWRKPGGPANDTTKVTYGQKNITITISPETGEYMAMVYPEVYTIDKITAPGYAEDIYNQRETINLTTAPVPQDNMMQSSIRTWIDSITVQRPGELPHKEAKEYSDTIRYHAKWTTYYQAVPTFSVTQITDTVKKQPVNYYGDKQHIYSDPLNGTADTLDLWDGNKYFFDFPVFKQGNEYSLLFNAYEEYKNETNGKNYRYAVDQGTVKLSNGVDLNNPEPIELDANGNGVYTFTAGAPDLTDGKHSIFATLQIGNGEYYWDKGKASLDVWHLGDKSTGTDFMTSGPNSISAILRDPPGSKSYSFIESGSTVSNKETITVGTGVVNEMNLTTELGPKVTTFIGLGGGVILESDITFDVSAGLKTEIKNTAGVEIEHKTTFTERFQTSDDPIYVGHNGDVFIGYSTNLQYGLTNGISIQKDYKDVTADNSKKELIEKDNFFIAPSSAIAYGQTFDTRFAFTQIEIETIMIPKWQDNLRLLLKPKGTTVNSALITIPVYVSNLESDDPRFGKPNMDKKTFSTDAADAYHVYDGPSYTVIFPQSGYDTKNFQDSVLWFNNQINGWTATLYQNEKEKVNMKKLGNYSFGSGVSIEWSKTAASTTTFTDVFHAAISPTIGLTTGAEVAGIGLELETKTEYTLETDISVELSKETSITSGFHLQEEGDDDEITVDYGMTESGTIAFKTRGGRTSCPYEGEVKTKYFEPEQHILSEGTMRIEVPVIDVIGPDRILNVPANRAAEFKLALKNESETGEHVWFELIVDEDTNPDGAKLSIDGSPIGNGRMFLVKAGQTLTKTLSVAKGTADSYDKIGLVLRSPCQSDPTLFLEVIADTTFISVGFVPACSEVVISQPSNNWIVNTDTGDSLRIVLNGFDRSFANFGYIKLEYRPESSPDWKTLQNFYTNEKIFNALPEGESGSTLIKDSEQNISYNWKMRDIPDGNYEIRATAVCVNTDSNGKIIGAPLSECTTQAIKGVKDLTNPESLGSPSPVNGIFTASDEISITFNEDIQTGMLTQNNFTITGVLNASVLQEPNTGLSFDGASSAHTELPISANGSFSIETWFKRTAESAGTLFSYGENGNYLSLNFDAQGHAIVKTGNEIKTSTEIVDSYNTWKYIGLSYNRTDKKISVYLFQGTQTIALFDGVTFNAEPATNGKLYLGKTSESGGIKGAIAQLHFYGKNRDLDDMTQNKGITKLGNEPNLIGLWELNEGEGTVAKDKARSRNLILNTGWYIYPAGKALTLNVNGTNQYAAIPSGTFPFRYYDDFTIEWQFNGAAQDAANLLSIGSTTHIGLDAEHKLVLTCGNKTQTLSANNLLDNQWHHVALSVKRNGMATACIDGVAAASFNSSSIFPDEVGGGFYWIGVQYTKKEGADDFSQYFKGYIDEIRVWNTALSTDAIKRNKNHKLSGTEKGLKAYYPFESWTKNDMDGTYNVLASTRNEVKNEDLTLQGATIGDIAAGMIDVRPATALGYPNEYTYTASSNKIVFNILAPLDKIEGVTLNISASDLLDLHGNKSKPAHWIAYVNRSSLSWETDNINIIMMQSENRTFKATIRNNSGVRTDYLIEDLPDWLTVDAAQGTLNPLATKELTFTIFRDVNIGNYEASVVLTGGDKVRKILPVRLKVTGQRPDWNVNPNDFESTMNMTGRIQIMGIYQEDENDLLGAFTGDLCVGLASPKYVPEYNAYYTFMDIYGNSEHAGQAITLKLWQAGTGNVYPVIESTLNGKVENLTFASNAVKGNAGTPVIHNAQDVIEQSIALDNGWNWISFNVENASLLEQFKTGIGDAGVQLKGKNGYLQPVASDWVGSGLSELDTKNMYMVKANKNHTLRMTGKMANPATTVIPLVPTGWSWISYTPQFTLPVVEALAGLNPQENDQVKAHSGYRTYMNGNGWIGSLNYMRAGEGYMFYSYNTAEQSLVYPGVSSRSYGASTRSAKVSASDVPTTHYTFDRSKYSNTMTVTGYVVINNAEVLSGDLEIAAFVGEECRGAVRLQKVEGMEHPYMGFLMIFGQESVPVSFYIYDHASDKEYPAVVPGDIQFADGTILGEPATPVRISTLLTGIAAVNGALRIYPNPVKVNLYITGAGMIENVRVLDLSGRLLLETHDLKENALNVSGLPAGTYLLRITADNETSVFRFVKE